MYEQSFQLSVSRFVSVVDDVRLDFGNIVRHVVNDVHVQVVWCRLKLFSEGLAAEKRHSGTIDPENIQVDKRWT